MSGTNKGVVAVDGVVDGLAGGSDDRGTPLAERDAVRHDTVTAGIFAGNGSALGKASLEYHRCTRGFDRFQGRRRPHVPSQSWQARQPTPSASRITTSASLMRLSCKGIIRRRRLVAALARLLR